MSLTPDGATASRPPSPAISSLHRIGDAERETVCEELSQHFVLGRLTSDELDERLTLANAAQVNGDLLVLVADLPRLEEQQRSAPAKTKRPTPDGSSVALVVAVVSALALISLLTYLIAISGGTDVQSPISAVITMVVLGAVSALTCGVASTKVVNAYGQRLKSDRPEV